MRSLIADFLSSTESFGSRSFASSPRSGVWVVKCSGRLGFFDSGLCVLAFSFQSYADCMNSLLGLPIDTTSNGIGLATGSVPSALKPHCTEPR